MASSADTLLHGRLDTTYSTYQRDLFESGLVAQIGPAAYAVWSAIKAHADFNNGRAWPSIRRLAEVTGIGKSTVERATQTLQERHLLRIVQPGFSGPDGLVRRSHIYIARERIDVRWGELVLCTVVIDYIPNRMVQQLAALKKISFEKSLPPEVWTEIEILPGPGFAWDADQKKLKASIPIPAASQPTSSPHVRRLREQHKLALEQTR